MLRYGTRCNNRCVKRNGPGLDDYRAVLLVLGSGSFRAAAEALGVSPSALSRQVAALERTVGARLFDRHTRRVAATPQGLAFARVAERTVNVAEAGVDEFEAFLAVRRGRLAIAALPSVGAGLLPPLLERFTAEHPDVDLRILDALSEGVLHAVEMGEADIGFAAGTPAARSRLSFHALLDDDFVALGTPDGPLAEERAYAWEELTGMPFVAMAEGTSVRELVDAACARIGRALEPRFEVSHLATAGALVAQGLGVTALPALTLPMLHVEPLVLRPLAHFGAVRRIGLAWRSGHTLSPAARAFLELVREETPAIRARLRGPAVRSSPERRQQIRSSDRASFTDAST